MNQYFLTIGTQLKWKILQKEFYEKLRLVPIIDFIIS